MTHKAKALAIEHETVGLEPPVVHRHTTRVAGACRPNIGRPGTAGEDGGHHAGVLEVIDRGLDGDGRVLNGHGSHVILTTAQTREIGNGRGSDNRRGYRGGQGPAYGWIATLAPLASLRQMPIRSVVARGESE